MWSPRAPYLACLTRYLASRTPLLQPQRLGTTWLQGARGPNTQHLCAQVHVSAEDKCGRGIAGARAIQHLNLGTSWRIVVQRCLPTDSPHLCVTVPTASHQYQLLLLKIPHFAVMSLYSLISVV